MILLYNTTSLEYSDGSPGVEVGEDKAWLTTIGVFEIGVFSS